MVIEFIGNEFREPWTTFGDFPFLESLIASGYIILNVEGIFQ